MSQPAIWVIRDSDGVSVYRNKYAAALPELYLIYGEAEAVAMMRNPSDYCGSRLSEAPWFEAAAVLDVEQGVLLWHGGALVSYDAAMHRYFHEVLEAAWPGWKILWATHGPGDITDYLGEQLKWLAPYQPSSYKPPDDWATEPLPDNDIRAPTLVTRSSATGLEAALARSSPDVIARRGGRLLVDHMPSVTEYSPEVLPSGGIHLDIENRGVLYWSSRELEHIRHCLQDLPDGWTVGVLEGGLKGHEELVPLFKIDWPGRQKYHDEVMSLARRYEATDGQLEHLQIAIDLAVAK